MPEWTEPGGDDKIHGRALLRWRWTAWESHPVWRETKPDGDRCHRRRTPEFSFQIWFHRLLPFADIPIWRPTSGKLVLESCVDICSVEEQERRGDRQQAIPIFSKEILPSLLERSNWTGIAAPSRYLFAIFIGVRDQRDEWYPVCIHFIHFFHHRIVYLAGGVH